MSPRKNWVTQEQKEAAQRVSVFDYFSVVYPNDLYPVGHGEYRSRIYSSLCVNKDTGVFNYWADCKGGNNAIDFLERVERMSFQQAVLRLNELCGGNVLSQPVNRETRKPVPPAPKLPFYCPVPDRGGETVQSYLLRRGISPKVFSFCWHTGRVYQTTRGNHRNCVFVGFDENDTPKFATLRSCDEMWRRDVPGSQKRYGFLIPAENPDCAAVEIYESPIDAMSGATIRQYQHREPWRNTNYLAIGGLNYMAADYFLSRNPQVKTVYLCLDNDIRGRNHTQRLMEYLNQKGMTVIDKPPKLGKDYNEQLQIMRSRVQRTNR